MKPKVLIVIVLVSVITVPVLADVKLPSLIADRMVLQQNSNANIWGWASPGEKVAVKGSPKWAFNKTTIANKHGKWNIAIATPKAGGPYEITIKANNVIVLKDILIGEVWICSGQSNMDWPLKRALNSRNEVAAANHPDMRLFTVKIKVASEPMEHCNGHWSSCSPQTAANFSAVAYYFGLYLQKELNVPIGLIYTRWSGTAAEAWTRKEYLQNNDILSPILKRYDDYIANFAQHEKEYQQKFKKWQQDVEEAKTQGKYQPRKPRKPTRVNESTPSSRYNGMIAPLIPYTIRGAIWYQGESNASRAWQYQTLFPTMIKNWRDDWNQGDFPFYFVQIAPWKDMNPEIREAQLITYRNTINTGIVVTTDIGDIKDIHPPNKLDVGKRLSLWALAKDCGRKNIVYSGPLYKSYKIEGDKIRIYFDHTGSGLMARDGDLTHFTIAGKDNNFVQAKVVIDGDCVVVSSDLVKKPQSVRFAWSNTAEPNFFNKEGLPASPFRTDNLIGSTFNKK